MNKKSPMKPQNSNQKSKKSTKEKKKTHLINEPNSSSSSSNSSTEKMQLTNILDIKYSGFSPDTIQCVSDQFIGQNLPDEVCTNLAEDLSFKIREIIHAASINMRQSKRKHLKVQDVHSSFKKYNIEPIYGASLPTWIQIGDIDNISCIPEHTINLLELAQSELTFQEPGDIGINYKWLNDTSLFNQLLVNNSLNNYCQRIMNAAVSNKKSLRNLALQDVAKNRNIGPIIPFLCNFCFLILQKNITYSSLAKPTLHLLEAIMFNPCTSFCVEEKQMTLLIYLLFETINNATNSMLHSITPIARTLGRLCLQWPRGASTIVEKLTKYLSDPLRQLSAPIILLLCYIGNEALDMLLWPRLEAVLSGPHDLVHCGEVHQVLVTATALAYKQGWSGKRDVENRIREEYGDGMMTVWRWDEGVHYEYDHNSQENWFNIKKSLIKTLKVHSIQQISHRTPQFKLYFRKSKPLSSNTISIIGYKELPVKDRVLPVLEDPSTRRIGMESVNIVTGKRTLCNLKRTFAINNKKCRKNIRDMMYML